jgi:DNA transformation protein and related proteins
VPESPGFVAFAVDLLSPVGPVRARAMFGGHGIYCGDVMIGLVDDDEIFLKTDDATRDRFLAAGCRRWVYTGGGRTMETSYFRPPDEAHESPEEMRPWGELALGAARRAAAAKRARAGKGRGKAAGKGQPPPRRAAVRGGATSPPARSRPRRPSRTGRPAPRSRR